MIRAQSAPTSIPIPGTDALSLAAHAQPSEIDSLLRPLLADVPASSLAKYLTEIIEEEVTRGVTPELFWGGDPSRPASYYTSCRVHATLLGRAYSLAPSAEQRAALWSALEQIFIKALFSGNNPEPGARYAAGILILTCASALDADGAVRGKGKEWVWYDNEIFKPEEEWGWEELREAMLATESLPRGNTDAEALSRIPSWEGRHPPEYIPQEVLDVLDRAREHLREGREDLRSDEVVTLFT